MTILIHILYQFTLRFDFLKIINDFVDELKMLIY